MDRKYYDLTPSQLILMYSQKYNIYKQVNNISISILMDKELDLDVLERSICKAYERNDALSIRLVKEGDKIKQYFRDIEEPSIEYLDFRDQSFEKMEKDLHKIASKRITNYEKPLSKVYIMNSYDGKMGIFFKVSHFIMDSWSISMFFKDVFAIYDSIKNDKDMPKTLPKYEDLLIEDLNYRNTETYKKDRRFFEEMFDEDEPLFSHVNGYTVLEQYRKKKKNPDLRYAEAFSINTKAKVTMHPVPKELVMKMEDYCASNMLPMQSLVLLAYRSYLSKVNKNQEDITINSVIARRGTLKEKNAGGSRVYFFPFRTIFAADTSFKEACQTINEKQTAIFRHSSCDPLEVVGLFREVYKLPDRGNYATSSVTFQPVKLALDQGTKIETRWYGNGTSSQTLYFTVMDGDGSGGLKFYYEHQTAVVKEETIKKLHSFMMEFLEKGITIENITVGELLEIEGVEESLAAQET